MRISRVTNDVILLLLLSFLNFIYIFLYFIEQTQAKFYFYNLTIALLFINILFLYFLWAKAEPLSPKALAILSVFIFILMRPVLSVFSDFEVITIGLKNTDANIIATTLIVLVLFNLIVLSTIASTKKIECYYRLIPEINIKNEFLEIIFLLFAISFSLYFLFMSYQGMLKLVSGVDYLKFVEDKSYAHLKYFFYAKFCFLFSYLFSNNRIGILFTTACCFIVSIGFILIGLRGYTIAYLFLFLCVFNLKYKINMIALIVIALGMLLVSSLVLNFRMGYSINESYFDMIFAPFHRQGATFEVVFGAVNFRADLINCISYVDYFLKSDFGSCVDQTRGVYFAEGGGFGSSYFAEVYYLGVLPALFISIVFGLGVSFLNSAYKRLSSNLETDKLSGVITFLLIPNLVYFARSSGLDYVLKSVEVFIFVLLISIAIRLLPKNA